MCEKCSAKKEPTSRVGTFSRLGAAFLGLAVAFGLSCVMQAAGWF